MQAGVSTKIITNEIGTFIQAAGCERKAESIRDELEANFFCLVHENGTKIIFINCDTAGFESEQIKIFRAYICENTVFDEREVIISATHMHSGPSVIKTNPFKDIDLPWYGRLKEWLLEGVREALGNLTEVRIGYAKGYGEIGYNRRCCWADGSHTMFGDTSRDDFTGIEGPIDSSQYVLFAEKPEGKIIGLIHNNSCHPVNFYGKNFYSADYPGLARKLLRDALGNIPVLYFNGGFGDNSPMDLLHPQANVSIEQTYHKQAYILAGETLRLIGIAQRNDDAILGHYYQDLEMHVRSPDEKQLEKDRTLIEQAATGRDQIKNRLELIMAYGRISLVDNFRENPFDIVPVHAIRVGECAIVTNPCELYAQFLIDLRRRSPVPVTLCADISDAYCGYCPTLAAATTGGYSGEAVNWTRLPLDAGNRIVDCSAELLHKLWKN